MRRAVYMDQKPKTKTKINFCCGIRTNVRHTFALCCVALNIKHTTYKHARAHRHSKSVDNLFFLAIFRENNIGIMPKAIHHLIPKNNIFVLKIQKINKNWEVMVHLRIQHTNTVRQRRLQQQQQQPQQQQQQPPSVQCNEKFILLKA